jgi:hypothetical protein
MAEAEEIVDAIRLHEGQSSNEGLLQAPNCGARMQLCFAHAFAAAAAGAGAA